MCLRIFQTFEKSITHQDFFSHKLGLQIPALFLSQTSLQKIAVKNKINVKGIFFKQKNQADVHG